MTPRQFAILIFLFSASIIAVSMTRSENQRAAPRSEPQPAKGEMAALVAVQLHQQSNPTIRVILPSPYEER
jgi:hypothetical protein